MSQWVVVEESYGTVYVNGPYSNREDAVAYVVTELVSIVKDWPEPWGVMSREELQKEWEDNRFGLFEDSDTDLLVVELLPPK